MMKDFKNIPSVDSVLKEPSIKKLLEHYTHDNVVKLVQRHINEVRTQIHKGGKPASLNKLVNNICASAAINWKMQPVPVINASGVILHTNLGRAPLSCDSTISLASTAGSYTDLEYQIKTGKRSDRQQHVQGLINQLTGSDSALVVNNNAAAALLCLTTIAKGKEVIVSKGESVEIGGNFRIPDLLEHSGAKLIEVGTTNRTYLTDYQNAVSGRTGAILKVHSSNFRTVGFTHKTTIQELVGLGNSLKVPILNDLGSGSLIDTAQFGLTPEPTIQESVAHGVDLTFFSGDKLLGGPQCGIILGQPDLINKLSKHPVARALRIDKLSLASLHTTLLHYLSHDPMQKIPIWQMISANLSELRLRANTWLKDSAIRGEIIKTQSTIGGGSLPGDTLETYALSIKPIKSSVNELSANLRLYKTPIISRIESNRVILDPRTVLPSQDEVLIKALNNITI